MSGLRIVANDDHALVSVEISGRTTELHALWLRDACSCKDCRRPTTNERLVDSTSIPVDLAITSTHTTNTHLVVGTSDGHDVQIDLDWLTAHVKEADRRSRPAGDHHLWLASSGHPVPTFDRTDIDTHDGLRDWLDAVIRSGAAIIRNVAPTEKGLREVASMVGEIRATNYGVTWKIEADLDPVSAVDSERHLFVHTDLPYRDVAPGVQLLLAAITDVAGGATTLVDGYAVAESLRQRDPEAWQLLTETEFTYPFIRDDVEFLGRAPIIGLHHDGSYHQIRRAPDLVGVPFVDAADTPALYRAIRIWTELVDHPDNEIQIALVPGDLLAFHNHRLLHGRTAFELGAHGRRQLLGCYLDIEDLRSKRAVLARTR